LEHLLFDQRPENVEKTPFRKVTPEGVKRFLDLSGERHNGGYFQYTNESALLGIYNNATLHLSLGRTLNDKVEFLMCDSESWTRTYIASFSFGTMESIGMWSVYGRPPEKAVRIAFPRHVVLSIRDAARSVDNLRVAVPSGKKDGGFSYRPLPVGVGIEHVSLHDVIYQYGREIVSENGSIRQGTVIWNRRMGLTDRCKAFSDCSRCPTLATYAKNVLWAGEFEVRLAVRLNRALSFKRKLAVSFPRNLLSGISVTMGPMTKNPDKTANRIERLCPGIPVVTSAFQAIYR